MKNILTFGLLLYAVSAFTQPIILNGNNIPSVGTTAQLYTGTPVSGIGSSGANQIWDFSNETFSPTGVTWTVVSPASTPYFSSFPSSNYGWTFDFLGTLRYFYFDVSAAKFDVLADNLLTPGSGNDFTPNPKTVLRFPSNYGDTVQDIFQKVGGSPAADTTTYDGYGTLITPFATYTNVWRVKESQSGGYGTYTWENENPLYPILVYTISNNSFTLFGNTPIAGIEESNNLQIAVNLYPNPANNQLTIQSLDKINIVQCNDYLGRKIMVDLNNNSIDISKLTKGIYFLEIRTEEKNTVTKKFIKQ